MKVQRTYSQPTCSLLIEGLDSTGSGKLSVLLGFELAFFQAGGRVAGGREVLEALIQAIGQYAQMVMMAEVTPQFAGIQAGSVCIAPTPSGGHALAIQAPAANGSEPQTTRIPLDTVQLFDLMETLDRLCADPEALPDLAMVVQVEDQEVRSRHRDTLLAALAGVATVAIAAGALLFVPIPPPKQEPKPQSTRPAPALTAAPQPTASPPPPAIADPAKVQELRDRLYRQVDGHWTKTPTFTQTAVYRVAVNEKGEVIGYQPVDPRATVPDDELALKVLLKVPVDPSTGGSPTTPQPTATFRVSFDPSGKLTVEAEKLPVPATDTAPPTPSTP